MKTKEILFTCYLLYNSIEKKYRFVETNETIEMVAEANETSIAEIHFGRDLCQGFLTTLVKKFGMRGTSEFIVHLLNHGIVELNTFEMKLKRNPNTSIQIPKEKDIISQEYRDRYLYLTDRFDKFFVFEICVRIIICGIQILSSRYEEKISLN